MRELFYRFRFILVALAIVCDVVTMVNSLSTHHPSKYDQIAIELISMEFGVTIGFLAIAFIAKNIDR